MQNNIADFIESVYPITFNGHSTVCFMLVESNEFILYAVRSSIHRYDLATSVNQPLPLTGLREAVALDFDYERNCLYWADISLDTIQVGGSSLTCLHLSLCRLRTITTFMHHNWCSSQEVGAAQPEKNQMSIYCIYMSKW